jgi:hypothetical protein
MTEEAARKTIEKAAETTKELMEAARDDGKLSAEDSDWISDERKAECEAAARAAGEEEES